MISPCENDLAWEVCECQRGVPRRKRSGSRWVVPVEEITDAAYDIWLVCRNSHGELVVKGPVLVKIGDS
jgi:hypothetical protein